MKKPIYHFLCSFYFNLYNIYNQYLNNLRSFIKLNSKNIFMEIYDQAWQSIIRPHQIKTKISSYGPRKKVVNNITIMR